MMHGYKKLIVFAIASGVVLAAGPLGIPAATVAKIVALASAYIVGQGIADHGKFRPVAPKSETQAGESK